MAREKGMGNLQQEKSGRWTARFSVDGKRFARSTRTHNKNSAEHFLNRMLSPFGRGEQLLPLAEVWREYEKSPSRREQTASTLAAKRVIWMKFAEWLAYNHLEITHLKQLTTETIAEYLRVFRTGHAASTYNNHICALREVFRCVAPKANITKDPWLGIRLLPDDSHTRREFSLEELRQIQSAAQQMGSEWALLITIGIYTGLRLGDCCRLSWQEVDLKRGIIQLVPHKTRKFGRMVTIPIHPELLSHLTEQQNLQTEPSRAANGLVLPEIATLYLTEHWRLDNALKRIFSAAGIRTSIRLEGRLQDTPDATFHSLRHTFVSFAANAGVPLPVVASIVGHSSTSMTRHYYHENEESLRKAIAAIPLLSRATPSPAPECRARHSESLVQRLKRLEHLLQKQLISTDEYTTLRTRLLNEV